MRVSPYLAFGLALGLGAARALAAGDNVVMLSVAHVLVPQKLPGLCLVDGTVRHVWQGRAFQEGDRLSLKVPCGDQANVTPLPARPISGARLTDPMVLRASSLGAAHLDDAGNLIWQPSSGDGGHVFWGYRVLQAVRLHLSHTA